MKPCLWFCFLFCFGLQANAQMSDSLYKALPDSLRPRNKLALTDNDRMRIILKTSSGFTYRFHNEVEAMVLRLQKSIETVVTNKDKMPYAKAIAEYYIQTGNITKEKEWFEKVIAYGEAGKANRSLLCNAYLNVAIIYAIREKQDSAVSLLHKATTIALADKDSTNLRDTYYVYIAIYNKLKLYHQAIENANSYLKALPARDKWMTPYTETVIAKAIMYSRLYRDKKKPVYADSTTVLVKQVMAATKKEEAYWYHVCYLLLGYLHYYMDDYPRAVQYYDLALLPKYTQPGSYQSELIYKAKVYRNLCLIQMGKAANISEVLAHTVPPRDFDTKQELNKILSQYYNRQGDYKKALNHYTLYQAYADSSDIIGQKGKVFEAEQKYSVAQKEATIAQLENKNLQAQATRDKLVVAGIISAMLVALLVYLRNKRQQSERQKLSDELLKLEDEMNFQSAQVQAENAMAMIEQRKLISQNMHDEVSTSLFTLQYYVADLKQNTQDKNVGKMLDDIEQETHQVYVQAREFMHWLYNSSIQAQYNVADFLHNLRLRFGEGSSLQIRTEVDEENIRRYFTPLHHNELYRIIKEAVTNSMKHSGASHVVIKVAFSKGLFSFSIADNGKGFTTGGDGMGMKNLSDRMALLNGTLQLNSTNAGTEISGSFLVEGIG